jgi:uridine phosphorylase
MGFPRFAGKQSEEAYLTPADFVALVRAGPGLDEIGALDGVVLVYQDSLWRQVAAWPDARVAEGSPFKGLRILGRSGNRVGVVGRFGIGAPAATIVLEELVAVGVRRFVSVGTAGALQPGRAPGDLVVCTGAVRDEGVSHHYLPSDVDALPSPALTERLAAALPAHERGMTWTTDAPYRETVAELRHYRAAGVRSVDMEAAALFAVGHVRGVEVASAFCYSDLLSGATWEPHLGSPGVATGLERLLAAAVHALGQERA